MDFFNRKALRKSLHDGKNPFLRRRTQLIGQIIEFKIFVADQSQRSDLQHAQAFLQRFFKMTPDGHNFTHGFHAGTDFARHQTKLL